MGDGRYEGHVNIEPGEEGDDVLLAHYFVTKPEGTSDKIFQEFARTVRATSYCVILALLTSEPTSIHTTLGKVGRNTTVFTRLRSIT